MGRAAGAEPLEPAGTDPLEPVAAVLGTVADAYVLLDLEGQVLVANARARRLLAGTEAEIPGPMVRWTPSPEEGERLLERWRTSSSPRPATLSLASGRRIRGDGARLTQRPWVLVRLRDRAESNAAYSSVVARLQSEHLRTLSGRLDATVAELHMSNRHLRFANEELQQYASAVAHDVRTPLFTIRGFAQMLRDSGHVDEAGVELVDLILESAERLHQTTESLLAVARLDEVAEVTGTAEVSSVLEEALDDQRCEIELTDAVVDATGVGGTTIAVPPVALRQVLQNLLANSLRFRDPQRPPRIEVTAYRTGDLVEIAVVDNGVGVAAAEHDHLFDLFQRGTRPAGVPGHGIGLATCRKLVNRWGGSIRCEPVSGPGARFVFTAPAERDTSAPGLV